MEKRIYMSKFIFTDGLIMHLCLGKNYGKPFAKDNFNNHLNAFFALDQLSN